MCLWQACKTKAGSCKQLTSKNLLANARMQPVRPRLNISKKIAGSEEAYDLTAPAGDGPGLGDAFSASNLAAVRSGTGEAAGMASIAASLWLPFSLCNPSALCPEAETSACVLASAWEIVFGVSEVDGASALALSCSYKPLLIGTRPAASNLPASHCSFTNCGVESSISLSKCCSHYILWTEGDEHYST